MTSTSKFTFNRSIVQTRRFFRSSKKYILLIVFLIFGLVYFVALFFFTEFRNSSTMSESVYKVYHQFRRAAPEHLILPPPLENSRGAPKLLRHEMDIQIVEDPLLVGDREKFKAKIEQDSELKVPERPDVGRFYRKSSTPSHSSKEVNLNDTDIVNVSPAISALTTNHYPLTTNGEDSDPVARERRIKIKKMAQHAWDNYVRYAWGKNELRPISKRGYSASIFGTMHLGLNILDSLDTLYIMGMHKEYKNARDWVANQLDIEQMSEYVSVFETNIRFVGSLLTCYSLTGDIMFREKAQQIADKLLPAFETPTGIPHTIVNFKTGNSKNYGWFSIRPSILSEFGGLHLEFSYLSDITGNPIYRNKVERIRQVLQKIEKPKGLYPNYLNPETGRWGQHHMSVGGLGDSFYEYLLKAWIQSNKEDNEVRQMFDEAMENVFKHMLHTSAGGLMYFADLKFDSPEHKMDHLGCFSGGMFALGAKTLKNSMSDRYMEVAKGITNTCHESYDRSFTKLGPEAFSFTEGMEAKAIKNSEKYYILRPEVIESYFYMYRYTKDPKYREWAWEAAQALEKHCRVNGGYTGLENVYSEEPEQDDVQQSFFLAETLKYLYLIFSDDNLISLDEWVFNTEAHPLPIKGVNPYYREALVL